MNRNELMPGDKILSPLGRILTISRNQLYTLPDEFFTHCRGVPICKLIDKYFTKNSAGYLVSTRGRGFYHVRKIGGKYYYDDADSVPLDYWHELQHLLKLINIPINLLPNEK